MEFRESERTEIMTRISIFGKTECAKCKTTKHKLSHLVSGELDHKVEVVYIDKDHLRRCGGPAQAATPPL